MRWNEQKQWYGPLKLRPSFPSTSCLLKWKPHPQGLLVNTDKCVYVHFRVWCVSLVEKKGGGWGQGVEGVCLAQHFLQTALTKASLFSRPVTQGDALMIARLLSLCLWGSRLNSSRGAPVLGSFCLHLARWREPQFNPLLPISAEQWRRRGMSPSVCSGVFVCVCNTTVIRSCMWHPTSPAFCPHVTIWHTHSTCENNYKGRLTSYYLLVL